MVWRPRVGSRPTTRKQGAGARMEPKPSEAWAMGSMRAPTDAAAPPDDPPEMRVVSHGLLVGPWSWGSQVRDRPSSQVLVRPKMTRPARLSRFTCSLSAVGVGVAAKTYEPRVILKQARESVRSLRRKGTPLNGRSGAP